MLKAQSEGVNVVIPPMVYFEVKRWLLITGASAKERVFERIYSYSGIGSIDKDMLDAASFDADILIAAFCVAHEYALVTNNTKHFKDIKNLKVVNWPD
jgi:predicted nucleic acid-binding protein